MATAVKEKEIEDIFKKMPTVRRDVMGVFTKYERVVKDQLGEVTRKANEICEDEEHNQVGKDSLLEKLEAEFKKMEDIKTKVEGCLEPLQPKDSKSSQDSSSKGKEGGKTEQDPLWVDMDKKLENFLEEAAKDGKGKDFDQLDETLKMCLLCLPIFPVGAVIRKRVLIYWWIGEGFITPKGGKAADQVGEEVFNDLVKGEFIQPVYNKRSGNVLKCKVHPWIHWMLITKSRETNFFVLDEKGMPAPSPSKTHRACLISDDGRHPPEPTLNPQDPSLQLRSLFNVNVRYLKFTAESFLKMKSIVALQLGRWQGSSEIHIEVEQPEVLERLGQLVQLRYLSLRGISVIETLPNAIMKLHNLKILDVRGCQNLKKLTKGITSLKRLTHLDVSECYMLESMPMGLGSMSKLEVLKGFVVGSSKTGRIVDLVKLPKLKKLSIIISSQARIKGDLHELEKMKALLSLTITWSILPLTTDEERNRKVNDLTPPSGLEKLHLECYPFCTQPNWLEPAKLPNLKRLYISGGILKTLHLKETEQRQWKIEALRLKFLKKMILDWSKIELPSCAYLELDKCIVIEDRTQPPLRDNDGVWTKVNGEASETNGASAASPVTSLPAAAATTTTTTTPSPDVATSTTLQPPTTTTVLSPPDSSVSKPTSLSTATVTTSPDDDAATNPLASSPRATSPSPPTGAAAASPVTPLPAASATTTTSPSPDVATSTTLQPPTTTTVLSPPDSSVSKPTPLSTATVTTSPDAAAASNPLASSPHTTTTSTISSTDEPPTITSHPTTITSTATTFGSLLTSATITPTASVTPNANETSPPAIDAAAPSSSPLTTATSFPTSLAAEVTSRPFPAAASTTTIPTTAAPNSVEAPDLVGELTSNQSISHTSSKALPDGSVPSAPLVTSASAQSTSPAFSHEVALPSNTSFPVISDQASISTPTLDPAFAPQVTPNLLSPLPAALFHTSSPIISSFVGPSHALEVTHAFYPNPELALEPNPTPPDHDHPPTVDFP